MSNWKWNVVPTTRVFNLYSRWINCVAGQIWEKQNRELFLSCTNISTMEHTKFQQFEMNKSSFRRGNREVKTSRVLSLKSYLLPFSWRTARRRSVSSWFPRGVLARLVVKRRGNEKHAGYEMVFLLLPWSSGVCSLMNQVHETMKFPKFRFPQGWRFNGRPHRQNVECMAKIDRTDSLMYPTTLLWSARDHLLSTR